MARLFVERLPSDSPSTIRLTGDDARYLINVLRMSPGDGLTLFSSNGREARAHIESTGRAEAVLAITEILQPRPEPRRGIVLVQGMLKGEKMELVIQKATELGVRAIVPVVTERSQVRETRKLPRWRKIALEASRQSGRPVPPDISEPESLIDFLSRIGAVRGAVFYEDERGSRLEASDLSGEGDVYLLVGPEGGLTKDEVRAASDTGFKVRGLGRNILRAETAAVFAVGLAGYLVNTDS